MFRIPAAGAIGVALAALLLAAAAPSASGQPGTAGEPERRAREVAARFTPRPLSPFALAKAERLLREKLPCLGCHELDGQGGRVGPGLSNLRGARSPLDVYLKISEPQRANPGTVMPRVPMSSENLDLIANYLTQRQATGSPPPAAPTAAAAAEARLDPPALYTRYCSHCHGTEGAGDGINARFLPVRPTAHSDSAYMSRRPDDSLFDAIYAGGYVMNRSPYMPAYGGTLTGEQIWSLVRHLRSLCGCEGPAWSRDEP